MALIVDTNTPTSYGLAKNNNFLAGGDHTASIEANFASEIPHHTTRNLLCVADGAATDD